MYGSSFNIPHPCESYHSEDSFGLARANLTPLKNISTIMDEKTNMQTHVVNETITTLPGEAVPRKLFFVLKETGVLKQRAEYSLWIFTSDHPWVQPVLFCIASFASIPRLQVYLVLFFRFRKTCEDIVNQKWFDNLVLFFIALNCITLAMERPNIPPYSAERKFLSVANYVFTVVFAIEMFIKVWLDAFAYEKFQLFWIALEPLSRK